MEKSIFFGIIISGILSFINPVYAESKLTILGDFGGEFTSQYWPKISSKYDAGEEQFSKSKTGKMVDKLFPIKSDLLSLGRVLPNEAKDIQLKMVTLPIFLIGDDPVSKKWLIQNKDFLIDKKAIGLVVKIENKQRMALLQNLVGKGLPLLPMSGDELARILKLKHYPFYVDQSGVMR